MRAELTHRPWRRLLFSQPAFETRPPLQKRAKIEHTSQTAQALILDTREQDAARSHLEAMLKLASPAPWLFPVQLLGDASNEPTHHLAALATPQATQTVPGLPLSKAKAMPAAEVTSVKPARTTQLPPLSGPATAHIQTSATQISAGLARARSRFCSTKWHGVPPKSIPDIDAIFKTLRQEAGDFGAFIDNDAATVRFKKGGDITSQDLDDTCYLLLDRGQYISQP